MQHAHFLNQTVYCCPVCRSGRFVTYRRLPAENGHDINRCSCRKCGMEFEVHEDREDKPVRGES